MAKGHKKSEPENLPACAAQYIKQVIRKMRYRRKVRADVQAELTAHFEDELKGCKTQAEKEQKAEQLIAGFGDAKLLAVLLRRAKKRCRPLWRTVVARTFQASGITIACLILYVVWFFSGKPVITTDYIAELNRIVRPVADDNLNAAPLYHKAAELYEKRLDDIAQLRSKKTDELTPQQARLLENDIPGLLRKKYNEVSSEQKQLIEKWLTDNRETLELVIAGSQKPYYWRRYRSNASDNSAIGVLMPHLSTYKNLARSLGWRAQLRAEQGRYQDAFDDTKSCYRFGQHVRGNSFLIEQLVGISVEAIALRSIRDILSKYQIDSAVLTSLQQDFEGMMSGEDFAVSLKAERLIMYDEIQRCFTSDRIGKGHLYLPRFAEISSSVNNYGDEDKFVYLMTRFLFNHPNKEETLESANELYDYWDQLCLKSAAQIHADSNAIDSKFEELLGGNIFLKMLTPAVKRVIEISKRVPTEAGATLTIIAILRYKQDTGRYPQNLNQLTTAGYLRQLPIDSFADKPLLYKETEDNFILYSVGSNFTDNGGAPSTDREGRVKNWLDNGDTVFWPVPKSRLKK